MFLGIEIGGTKLQLGIGAGDGTLEGLWRGTVDPAKGSEGIRNQIVSALPALLASCGLGKCHLRGAGIGFGGPVDDDTRTVIKSHQIAGWDNFPLADWLGDALGLPAVLGNDADVAGLAEALFGAGKGLSPIFYVTVGSGIGGGLIIDGEIYRGCGRGAAEIGHLRFRHGSGATFVLEDVSSGWGMQRRVQEAFRDGWGDPRQLRDLARGGPITVTVIAEGYREDDTISRVILTDALAFLADALCHVIVLLCPRRIVIGGGVSLIGEEVFFGPLRTLVNDRVFPPFRDLFDIVPAALGEEVVVHGALALARKNLG